MTKAIDFYWDVGSTNTYFALHLLKGVAERTGAQIRYHPFNLGYVFRTHNYILMEEPKEKLRHRGIDLQRWAKRYNLPFSVPRAFPIKTSRALRGALAMRRYDLELPFMEAIFSAYWERGDASIAEFTGLRPIAKRLGVDPDAFEQLCESEEVRDELARGTDGGLARGVFGAPTMFVGDDMFWGKDRMDFVEDALRAHDTNRS